MRLEDRMRQSLAEQSRSAVGLRVAPDARQLLMSLIVAGAGRADADRAISSDEAGDLADANLRTLLSRSEEIARAAGADTIHAWSIAEALRGICPLYPFC
jgi:hypothetical protein